MKIKFLALLFLFPLISIAKENKYPIMEIPDVLCLDADIVIRDYSTTIKVNSAKKAEIKVTHAITLFNENGYNDASFSFISDKLKDFKLIKVSVYNASGEYVKSITRDALTKDPLVSDDVYIDGKLIRIEPSYYQYPFTIEYEYEITLSGTVEYPDWFPVYNYNMGLEKASLTLIYPAELKVRTKGEIENAVFDSITIGDIIQKKWIIEKYHPVLEKSINTSLTQIFPYIEISPTYFKAEEFQGNMTSWNELGKSIYSLNKGLQELPEEAILMVEKSVRHIDLKREKIKAIYQLLQKNTRYVSIQIGVGGWQPISAEKTWEEGYGDCKALTNLMRAFLMNIGIESYYTVIKSGPNDLFFDTSFPANSFNHALLCIPMQNDTIWLECTSQTAPFNYLGKGTSDRNALLITENGGVMVKTPSFSAEQNQHNRMATVEFDTDFNANVMFTIKVSGEDYMIFKNSFEYKDANQRDELIIDFIKLPSIDICSLKMSANQDTFPPVFSVKAFMNIKNPVVVLNDRIIISPSMLSYDFYELPKEDEVYTFVLDEEYCLNDSIDFVFAKELEPLNMPEDVEIETPFGVFRNTYKFENNILSYYRYFHQKKGVYTATDLSQYREFINEIYSINKKKIAFQMK